MRKLNVLGDMFADGVPEGPEKSPKMKRRPLTDAPVDDKLIKLPAKRQAEIRKDLEALARLEGLTKGEYVIPEWEEEGVLKMWASPGSASLKIIFVPFDEEE